MDFEEQFERERLHFAAGSGDLKEVKRLLAANEAVNQFDDLGLTPLHHAIRGGHITVAKALLNAGANINAIDDSKAGNTPLADVADDCSLDVAKFLLEHGADPSIPGTMQLTALYRAEQRKRGNGPAIVRAMWDFIKHKR